MTRRNGWTMSQVALSWLLDKGASSPIIGLSSLERMEEALRMRAGELGEGTQRFLEEDYLPKNIMGHG